jgi:ATP-dependent RNA helicase RhlE
MDSEMNETSPSEPVKTAAPENSSVELRWEDLGLNEKLLGLIDKAGYRKPTPVQAESIPLIVEGHDVLGSAATGSGKTATFVLPTVQRFAGKEGTFVLALSPTREIAQQTHAVFETFGGPLGLRAVVLIGGANMRLEEQALATYPQIIVATPGRLCDHLERGNLWLDYVQTFILDEADRMLDMGFSDQLSRITEHLPKERQTLMFSATFAGNVERLARSVMYQPKQVTIGRTSETAPKIEQRGMRVREEEKVSALIRLFKQEAGTIIVFCRSKDRVSKLWRSLHSRLIYDATFIHSDCTQSHREKAIADFKAGTYRILIATDVAGRGIDVDDVAHVVNFDLPFEPEDYVHRIGRTGRRGKTGIATSFVTDRDREVVRRIEKLIGQKILGEGADAPSPSRGEGGRGGEGRSERSNRGGDRGSDRGARRPEPRRGERTLAPAGAKRTDAPEGSPNPPPSEEGNVSAAGGAEDPNSPPRRRRRRGGRGRRGPGSGGEGAGPASDPTES